MRKPEKKSRLSTLKPPLQTAAAALVWLAVWQLVSMLSGAGFLIPSVPEVFSAFIELCSDKSFYLSCLSSLLRVLCGWLTGLICGVFLALITNLSAALRIFFAPVLHIIKATPVASFIILALFLMKSSRVPAFTAFLIVLPLVWANISEGLRAPSPELCEMAKAFHMKKSRQIRYIYIPALIPYLSSAALTSMGLSWKAAVAAEVICTPSGSIGAGLQNAKIYLESPQLFAWTLTVILLSMLLERILKRLLGPLGEK